MFRVQPEDNGKVYRVAVFGLLLLSAAALAISLWELYDFAREQVVVEGLIESLPAEQSEAAEFLAGELRWQFRLTILVVLNVVATGLAIALLWRAYRLSQESLRDIKTLAGDILSSMDQAIITTDLDGVVTSINRCGLEMLAPQAECVGRPLEQLSQLIELEDFRHQWSTGQSRSLTCDFKIPSGASDRIVRSHCQVLKDFKEVDIGFLIQLHDVTDRVLVEEQMRRMERYLGLGSLAAGLHHEIKNPLAALSLHVQLIEEHLDETDPSEEVTRMLGIVKTEVRRVGAVLESFRDFASIGQLNIARCNLRDMISRQIDLIQPQAKAQSVTVELKFPDGASGEVFADQVRLEQVLLNLLVNALEAMPTGGKLELSLTYRKNEWSIAVSDTGPGIPENLAAKIFDPYFTTKSEGTGLGLALCDKIIRQHHGRIELSSSNRGSVFRVSLPSTPPETIKKID